MAKLTGRVVMVWLLVAAVCAPGVSVGQDPRDIRTGREIPSLGYADQPMAVTLNDGSWLCVLTTGPGEEGEVGQHVVATRSADLGRTWSEPVAIERARASRGGESAWAVPLHVPHQGSAAFGRVYVFYVFHGAPVREVPNREPGSRLDMLGWYVFRSSDDGGATWSNRRRIRIPLTEIDRRNTFRGEAQMFWGCSKPAIVGGRVLIPFSKIRRHLVTDTEGWVLACDNLLTEPDPTHHAWELLPNGNTGPAREWTGHRSGTHFGEVQSEHTLAAMDTPGHLLMINRTDRGLISQSTSRDGGATWSEPAVAAFADGRPVRHPRANAKAWRIGDGRYLLWHHNNAGTDFIDRNPAWLSGGIERGDDVVWGEPEILLYDHDPEVRISYPDLVVEDGRFWLFETQKSIARVHEIDAELIGGLWDQFDPPVRTEDSVVYAGMGTLKTRTAFDLAAGGSFSVELGFDVADRVPGEVLASDLTDDGHGWSVRWEGDRRLLMTLSDGTTEFTWQTDPLGSDETHAVVLTVDSQSRILTVIANGRLQDGAGQRQFGWGRIPATLGTVGGSGAVSAGVETVVHGRALTTAEAVGNTR